MGTVSDPGVTQGPDCAWDERGIGRQCEVTCPLKQGKITLAFSEGCAGVLQPGEAESSWAAQLLEKL